MLSRTFNILILALVVFVGLAGLALIALPRTGRELLSVQSGSMSPYFDKGDMVIVKDVPDEQIAVGDVITFVSPVDKKVTMTHRVIETPNDANQYRFITRGDANPAADDPVLPRQVQGEVESYVPYAGRLLDLLRQPAGLIVAIYLPALWIVADEMRRLARHYSKQKPWRHVLFSSESAGLKFMPLMLGAALLALSPARPALALDLNDSARLIGTTLSSARVVGGRKCGSTVTVSVNSTTSSSASGSTSSSSAEAYTEYLVEETGPESTNVVRSVRRVTYTCNNSTNINISNSVNQTVNGN